MNRTSQTTTLKLSDFLYAVECVVKEQFYDTEWVEAEVSSISGIGGEGHSYLELVELDDNGNTVAHCSAHIWKRLNFALASKFAAITGRFPSRGDKVRLLVRADFNARYGFSLNILDIDPSFTLGGLAAKKIETRQRLIKEGLYNLNKEIEVPVLPFSIAVVSAPQAAGYRDFMRHIEAGEESLNYRFCIELFEAPMQGGLAPEGICSAFENVNKSPQSFDAVVFIRGGGSELDLACFDDYLVSKAIAHSLYPVISGIGHDKDNHLCDEVASVHVKTPTAAADFLIERIKQQKSAVEEIERSIFSAVKGKLSLSELILERLQMRLNLACRNKISIDLHSLDILSNRLYSAVNNRLTESNLNLEQLRGRLFNLLLSKVVIEEGKLSILESRIKSSDPKTILGRGYALLDSDGKRVSAISALREGGRLRVQMRDGVAEFTIKELIIRDSTNE